MYLPGFLQSKPNILSVKYKKTIDEQLIYKLTFFLQSSKRGKIITEINSTINSLVSGVLLQKALGEKAIAMVFDFDTPKTNDLINFCKILGLNTYVIKRGRAYQTELAAYRLRKEEDIRNFYKRFVNYHLSIQVDFMKASLIDTIDKSERLMGIRPEGFYGHIMPLYSLYKTEVYDLAKFLKIPDQPSTNYDYWEKIDPVLFLLLEKQTPPEEIAQEFNIDLAWLKKLKAKIDKQPLKSTLSQFII